MKTLFKIEDKCYKGIQAIAIVLLCFMTTLFFIQTVLRFTVRIALPWAEELCRYTLIWAVFLESGIGITKGIHVGFDLLSSRLKGSFQTVIYIITQIVVFIIGTQVVRGGWVLTLQVQKQLSASLSISMSWFYLSIPVGGVLLCIYTVMNVLRKLVRTE
ncbi:MAG: TRAP transporter small permease [Lachnospiraceae bacterium]|nr:TRAP transporter small permease [Lachnospiraceae bacterium]